MKKIFKILIIAGAVIMLNLSINTQPAKAVVQSGDCITVMGWDFCLRWCGGGCCYINALTTSCVGVPQ
jgi:hypothetical protein